MLHVLRIHVVHPQVGGLCTGAGCRRKAVLRYFGEQRSGCDSAVELPCDWCQDRQVAYSSY